MLLGECKNKTNKAKYFPRLQGVEFIEPHGSLGRRVGLLNHRWLPPDYGLLFYRPRFLHSMHMRFPLLLLAYDAAGKPCDVAVLHPGNVVKISPQVVWVAELAWSEEREALLKNMVMQDSYEVNVIDSSNTSVSFPKYFYFISQRWAKPFYYAFVILDSLSFFLLSFALGFMFGVLFL